MNRPIGYLEIVEIFRQIAYMHQEVKQFVFFDTDKLEAAARSNLQYPCIFMTLPSYTGNAMSAEYDGTQIEVTIAILDRATSTLNMEAQALHLCSLIAQDVIHQLGYSERLSVHKWSSEPLQNFIADNTHGYDINITMEVNTEVCRNVFHDSQVFDSFLDFVAITSNNIAPGQTATINTVANHPSFTLEVKYTKDGITTTSSALPATITLGTGLHTIEVTATHSSGYSFKRKLSFIPSANRTYYSIPQP